MDEQEFDSLMQSRPFGRDDAMRADLQLRRGVTLAIALWGRTPDDLQRQLLAPSPQIPSGFDNSVRRLWIYAAIALLAAAIAVLIVRTRYEKFVPHTQSPAPTSASPATK
jgi:hypothetical protein